MKKAEVTLNMLNFFTDNFEIQPNSYRFIKY